MIIKGRSRASGGQLAHYLLTENSQQKARLLEQRGSVANDLSTMLRYWEAEALATTKGEKPLYHAQIRLAPGEYLQAEQWLQTLDRLEQKLKLTENPRAIVMHCLNGEDHLHIVYSRLDPARGVLRSMGHDRKTHHAVAREMEREFGLKELTSKPRRDRNGNAHTRSVEHRQAKEAGTNRQALCAIVKAAWESSKTGRELQDQLAVFGMTLTLGERRAYNLWHEGKRYNPVRLLENVRVEEFRTKMQNETGRPVQHQTISAGQLSRQRAKSLQRGSTADTLATNQVEAQAMVHEALANDLNRLIREQERNRRSNENTL